MRNPAQILALLDELTSRPADDLEDQDLDFKQWDAQSIRAASDLVVEMAVCMANGGGGTVVFGVADKPVGRAGAILGVPPEVDVNRLRQTVYDRTDPKITPVFESVAVPEGTGRLILMQVYPGLAPYTDTGGRAKIRIGKDCQPLTGTLRRRLTVETGENDYTAEPVPGPAASHLSARALEELRGAARREAGAPEDLLRLTDEDLLSQLKLIERGHLTRAGVIVAGSEQAIRQHVPHFTWTYLRMRGDTEYADRADGPDAIAVALNRMLGRIMSLNPLETVRAGMFHFEYRTYPELALREALLNALCHADFRTAGPILVKQFDERLEISNPGEFIGGVSASNLLHHPPVARNPRLVEALIALRLVNRSNLGVGRMYRAMLVEGKEPPAFEESGRSVRVTLRAAPLVRAFRTFVTEEEADGRPVDVDHLILLRHLLRRVEIDVPTAAIICQRGEEHVRETLAYLEVRRGYLERGGGGRAMYWALRSDLYARLASPVDAERNARIDWEAAKTRVLSTLKRRSGRGEPGMSNAEVRRLTHYDREQVKRLLQELRDEANVGLLKAGRFSRWTYVNDPPVNP